MAAQAAFVTVKIPRPRGFCRLINITLKPPPVVLSNRGTDRGDFSPLVDPVYYVAAAPGKTPPVSPRGRGDCVPRLREPVDGCATGDVIVELSQVRETLAEMTLDLAAIDNRLAPFRDQRDELRLLISEAHNGCRFNIGRGDERRPMFAGLDALALRWGPLCEERRGLFLDIKSLEWRERALTKMAKPRKARTNAQ